MELKPSLPYIREISPKGVSAPYYEVRLDETTTLVFQGDSKAKVLKELIFSSSQHPRTEAELIETVYADDKKFSFNGVHPFANRLSVRVNTINKRLFEKNDIPYRIQRKRKGGNKNKEVTYFLEKVSSHDQQQIFPSNQPDKS